MDLQCLLNDRTTFNYKQNKCLTQVNWGWALNMTLKLFFDSGAKTVHLSNMLSEVFFTKCMCRIFTIRDLRSDQLCGLLIINQCDKSNCHCLPTYIFIQYTHICVLVSHDRRFRRFFYQRPLQHAFQVICRHQRSSADFEQKLLMEWAMRFKPSPFAFF